MNNNIKNPIFVIAEDSTVEFLHEFWEVDCCNMEPIDVADGLYTAYDSEGQILNLVTINEETGQIERPTESYIKIPFLGKIGSISLDRTIKAIPTGIKDRDKLMYHLARDLSQSGHKVHGLRLRDLVAIYEKNIRDGVY
jgi:hypothetical protein